MLVGQEPKRRGGYVMVLLAMLLFGLMAMAALVIDLGFARLAQRQMQTAADAAALEGLRGNPENARERAQDLAALTFDDDFDLSGNPVHLGAGPVFDFSNGVVDPDLHAGELVSLPETPSFRPSGPNALATNPGNDIAGDMLSGLYAFGPPEGSAAEVKRTFHQEDEAYRRSDFPNPDPDGVLNLETHPAFLVRLRRTGETLDPGIGTAGPTVPFLFGRGSALPRDFVGAGISVRATSIAGLQPVVCVGNEVRYVDENGILRIVPGKLDLAVSLQDWKAGSGSTFRAYTSNAIGGPTVRDLNPSKEMEGYLAIFDPSIEGDRVIGFGPANISYDAVEGWSFDTVHSFEIPNASPVFCFPFEGTGGDDQLVFNSRLENRNVLYQLPVSVRN